MDEELNYANVVFKTDGVSTHENNLDTIYEEVKTQDAMPENKKKAPLCTLLQLVATGLGIICFISVSVLIAVTTHFNTVLSQQHTESTNLTAQNLQLWIEMRDLERQIEELTRQRDGLNWTIGVILEYNNFPVDTRCPQKVCKPCPDDWVLFQSNCYLFSTHEYSYYWKTWEGSRDECKDQQADLMVIDSQEEQEFMINHTKKYNDERHGYWIGLKKMDTWSWVDGSNFTVTYWKTQQTTYRAYCALSQPRADHLANWFKASCDMKNRWICETRALIKSD